MGLGGSVEKLHYLPEAHTDFLLAVIGEELGLVGVLIVIALFFFIVQRAFAIGQQAIGLDRVFAGLVAKGIGIWLGAQTFINMGVNLGLLPTKGLTLPLMSYGGSGILVNCIALAVLLRIDMENRGTMRGHSSHHSHPSASKAKVAKQAVGKSRGGVNGLWRHDKSGTPLLIDYGRGYWRPCDARLGRGRSVAPAWLGNRLDGRAWRHGNPARPATADSHDARTIWWRAR